MNDRDIETTLAALTREHLGPHDPTAAQLRALLSAKQDGPFHFVNLLSFRAEAAYPAEHALAGEQLSGADAYGRYGVVALEHVTRRGGRLVTLNAVEQQLIGASGGWHQVATMEYRNVGAFVEMVLDPEYRAALVHRDAGLAATAVLVTRPLIAGPIG